MPGPGEAAACHVGQRTSKDGPLPSCSVPAAVPAGPPGAGRPPAYHARYVSGPLGAGHVHSAASGGRAVTAAPSRPASRLAQLSTLVRRYLSVIASDRNYVGVIALLPVILGVLIRAIPDAGGLVGPSSGPAIQCCSSW